jgi:hypothetical protein
VEVVRRLSDIGRLQSGNQQDLTPDPIKCLMALFTTPPSAIAITGDDEATIISTTTAVPHTAYPILPPGPASLIYVKQHPYQQEANFGAAIPLIVVGPATRAMDTQTIGYGVTEIHEFIEVRVLTRDITDSSYLGVTMDGNRTRKKILRVIRSIVATFAANPDNAGTFQYMRYVGEGKDQDEPTGNPLYKTPCMIEVVWYE